MRDHVAMLRTALYDSLSSGHILRGDFRMNIGIADRVHHISLYIYTHIYISLRFMGIIEIHGVQSNEYISLGCFDLFAH